MRGTTLGPTWLQPWKTAAPEYRVDCHDWTKPMSLKGKIASVALTDTGRVREHNEDMIGAEADIGLFVLADGMGGYNAGEVASGIAVKTIINLVRDAVVREDLSVPDAESGLTRPSIILRDAIHRANKIIYHTSKTQPQCEGMGTTVVACLFHDNKMSIAQEPRLRYRTSIHPRGRESDSDLPGRAPKTDGRGAGLRVE